MTCPGAAAAAMCAMERVDEILGCPMVSQGRYHERLRETHDVKNAAVGGTLHEPDFGHILVRPAGLCGGSNEKGHREVVSQNGRSED
jgi:hypothetical protein